jgi:hypothetical protein
MSDIVTLYVPSSKLTTCLDNSERIGKRLYKNNENYRTIANVMEHPEFRKFFDKYFSSWDDIKTVLMFLKLYHKIEQTSSVTLNGYQKLSVLDAIIKDRQLRSEMCQEVCKETDNIENLLE